jgi:hypothetical protein
MSITGYLVLLEYPPTAYKTTERHNPEDHAWHEISYCQYRNWYQHSTPPTILFFTISSRSSMKFPCAISSSFYQSTLIMWFPTNGVGPFCTEMSSQKMWVVHVEISDVDIDTCITFHYHIKLHCKIDITVYSLQHLCGAPNRSVVAIYLYA